MHYAIKSIAAAIISHPIFTPCARPIQAVFLQTFFKDVFNFAGTKYFVDIIAPGVCHFYAFYSCWANKIVLISKNDTECLTKKKRFLVTVP